MDEQRETPPGGDSGVEAPTHNYRYQITDHFSDARYIFYSASEAVRKVTELGSSRFQYVPSEGQYVQIGQFDGQWQAFEFEHGAGSKQIPLPGETLQAIQWREDVQALASIHQRASAVEGSAHPEAAAAAKARAFADAAALRRIDDQVMREDAAVTLHAAAQASEAYRDGLTEPPFQRTGQEVAELIASADAKKFAQAARKGAAGEQEPNQIEEQTTPVSGLGGPGTLSKPAEPSSTAPAEPLPAGPIDPALTQTLLEGFDRRGPDYFFKGTDNKAFSDKGARIISKLDDRDTIAGMLTCAETKGWRSVHVKGTEQFRRQAWYAAKQRGLDVTGYEPTREEAALFPDRQAQPPLPTTITRELNAIEPGQTQVAGGGTSSKPLPPEVEQAGIVGPARIEASLDDAHRQIGNAMGERAKVFRAETRAGNYRGEIIGETQMHVIQRISPRMAVIHNKVDVAGGIIGQRGVYAYKGGRAKFAANREHQLQKAGLER